MTSKKGFLDILRNGETIICADGYKTELDRRGFTDIRDFKSRVVTEYPIQVRQLHEEFVHCGSDVVIACIGHGTDPDVKEDNAFDGETSNIRQSLEIARTVADKSRSLMAGRVNSTGLEYGKATLERMEQQFTSQIKMVVEEGADFILGEMFKDTREAKVALKSIKQYGKGLASVMTLCIGDEGKTTDGVPVPEALRALELSGADVVGLACARGPTTMMPLMREARNLCKGPLAAMPAAYRTKVGEDCILSLTDPLSGQPLYPLDLDKALCCRKDIQEFAKQSKSLGIQFIGLCCGAHPSFIREIADIMERETPASKFNLDLSKCNLYLENAPPVRAKRRIYQLTQEYNKMYRMTTVEKS